MKTIYYDTRFTFSVSKISGEFNGGNNYSKKLLEKLLKENVNLIIICTDETIKKALVEEFSVKPDKFVLTNSINNLVLEKDSIYFNPQCNDSISYFKELKVFKVNNPSISIKITIHDRRHHEDIIDKYNGILKAGIKSNYIILAIGKLINSKIKDNAVKRIMSIADQVYTVSNYSMQELLKLGNTRDITYYIQDISFNEKIEAVKSEYILFVSAGRSEKNFIRALKAFEKYVLESGNQSIILKATGLSKKQIEILKEKNIVSLEILNRQVDLLGYVDFKDFPKLYANSKFLLFTSKSEGYGLPVSEALFFEKPVVASRLSSIPEVLGSAAIYVNPYSISSICNGIEKMMNKDIYSKYLEFVKLKKNIWKRQVELDNIIMMERLKND